jgi:CubicO group peptidase (beta-lactamase class C family)
MTTPEEVGLSRSGLDAVDAAVQQHIDQGVLAGAVTLVARHGQVVHTAIMGVDDTRTGKRLALDTIFRIFSMTKPVTAVCMMILHDQGLWSPNDPIARHLPELEGLSVATGVDERGRVIVAPAEHQPSMAELMTHTAGFSYGGEPGDAVDALYVKAKLTKSRSAADFVSRIARLPLAYQPGTRWRYSVSVDLQGAIIERITGRSLPEFMQEHIFGPLGMVDTAFHTPPEKLSRRAKLYYTGGKYHLRAIKNPLFRDSVTTPSLAIGGAGLVSTIEDYARFCQLILNRGEWDGVRIVSAEALELMMTNHLSDDLLTGGFHVGHQHIRPGFGFGYDGVVFSDPELAGIPVGRGTYMWDGAAGTWFWIDPENDLFFIGMIQFMSLSAPPLQAMTQTLLADAIVDRGSAAS